MNASGPLGATSNSPTVVGLLAPVARGRDAAPGRLGAVLRAARRMPALAAPALAAAAALAVLVAVRTAPPGASPSDKLRAKGASHVWVYWERNGVAQPWAKDVALQDGDRVRAEVLAGPASVAYLAVEAGDGRLLSDPAKVQAQALTLGPGERGSFAGSFQLVGPAEDERLLLVVCEAGASPPALAAALPATGQAVDVQALPASCGTETFALRGSSANP